uniref:Sugar phosphate transporter domain-containing protein n=1 Tax=Spongospora subterranea TaxID=70186 RepID=A0A0H5R521_9EUKA|eukprot:CRZ09243.1 hypothetical protein [Spongospora subterranea]
MSIPLKGNLTTPSAPMTQAAATALSNRRQSVIWAVSFYWIVSIALVFLNKESMNRLNAPIFITWTQLVYAVLGCYALSRVRNYHPSFNFFPEFKIRPDVALQVLPLTVTFIAMISFNNMCLQYVNVSFYQVARSLTIVFNVAFTYLLMGQSTSTRALATVAAVITGYIIGSSAELSMKELSVRGSVFGILASAFVSLYAINVKRVLPAVDNNKWTLMIYNNVIASVLMLPLIVVFNEVPVIISTPAVYTLSFWLNFVAITGIFGFLINIATYAQIQATSPLTHNISGTAKSAFQSLMALIFLREPISIEGAFGLFLVIIGSFLYGWVRDCEMSAKPVVPAKYEQLHSIVSVDDDDDCMELGETKDSK